MHETSTPADAGNIPAGGSGNDATRYLPLCDIHARDTELVITSLRRARIASYVSDPVTSAGPGSENALTAGLFVDAGEMSDSRAILSALGIELPTHARTTASTPGQVMDMHGRFTDLTSDWNVDTAAAIRAAEKDIRHEDAQRQAEQESELAEEYDADSAEAQAEDLVEHYVAPTPPPLPRPAAPTLRALLVIALGIAVLVFGGLLELDPDFILLLGVGTLLTGVGLLVMRLRPHRNGDFGGDYSDDGAIL